MGVNILSQVTAESSKQKICNSQSHNKTPQEITFTGLKYEPLETITGNYRNILMAH